MIRCACATARAASTTRDGKTCRRAPNPRCVGVSGYGTGPPRRSAIGRHGRPASREHDPTADEPPDEHGATPGHGKESMPPSSLSKGDSAAKSQDLTQDLRRETEVEFADST